LISQWLAPVHARELGADGNAPIDRVERPAQVGALVEASALGAAPLRLAYGMGGRVNGFAAFSQENGPMSSMPALVLHRAAADVHSDLVRLIAQANPEDAELLPRTAEALHQRRPLQAAPLLLRHLLRAQTNPAP